MLETRIMQTAAQVLDAHWDGNVPVNPIKIAAAMGIRVRVDDLMGESGTIELTDDGPLIFYKGTEIQERRRFTVAHEIGHFALGHLKPGATKCRDFTSNFSSHSVNLEEREANSFAAQLLMPAKVVKFMVTENGITNFQVLAEKFGVSQVAMKYRLNNMGLVNA